MAPIRLTPDLERQIVAAIRAGCTPHVAAESFGVPRRLFLRWLARGRKRARPPYRPFWLNVIQARAHARFKAETEVRTKDVKFWLRNGPGGAAGKSKVRKRGQELSQGALNHLITTMLQALTPYPEARLALLEALEVRPEGPTTPGDAAPSGNPPASA